MQNIYFSAINTLLAFWEEIKRSRILWLTTLGHLTAEAQGQGEGGSVLKILCYGFSL